MANKNISLVVEGVAGYLVRTIAAEDIELLREWKNANRESFFFKEIITSEMQKKWFESYLHRDDDFMLMIVSNDAKIGCIGFRKLSDRIDLYNLMTAKAENAGKGHMARALELVCAEARQRYSGLPVMVSVLRKNPALAWYFRRGFVTEREHDTYLELTYKK